jgi:hypothetical protein
MSRYDPLRRYLASVATDQREVRLSFRDMERIVGTLPPSARNYRAWWGNNQAMPQALAWQQAGFVVETVNLTAEHVVFVRGRAQRRSSGPPVITRRVDQPPGSIAGPSAGAVEDDHTEAAVQARLVAYLVRRGWRVHRVADTASREQGVDIVANDGRRTWAIEVKGYPSHRYADPRREDQIKPTNPSVQARHWYAAAVLKAILTRDEHPEYQIAIAFPDMPTYRSLHRRTRRSLNDLTMVTFFIAPDGDVTAHEPSDSE